jgi:NAD(P)-dependent dehydrogenase (short-subunit alcohol dehydrogenase family)
VGDNKMKNYLEGKAIIVTGGGFGFGQRVSDLAAKQGAKVVIADINEENAAKVATSIKESGGIADLVIYSSNTRILE